MLYRALGALGHSVRDVREMYLWQCASFLGADGRDPVIAGSRSLQLPRDDTSHGRSGAAPTLSDERVAEAKRRFDERVRQQHAQQQAAEAASERS